MSRRIAIVGGGPAGLYLACLLRRRRPRWRIRVLEQNPRGATFGFGVVFSDRALEFLREDDPETFAAITPAMETWQDLAIVHREERVVIDGIGFSAIGRVELLERLEARLEALGVRVEHECTVSGPASLGEADLIVGADGVNSRVRTWAPEGFGTRITCGSNRFAWFGTTRAFPTLTQTFRSTRWGPFTAHHYRYAPDRSTFIVELEAGTWRRAGLGEASEEESRALCEEVFAPELGGHPLLLNRSIWRRFPCVRNEHWWHQPPGGPPLVLLGDALHTAHFSIGSGTRLAMEDAIALSLALSEGAGEGPELREALARWEAARRPVVDAIVAAAEASMGWYERMSETTRLEPLPFAMSYVRRSGRVDLERLRASSPRFVDRWEAATGGRGA